MISTVSSNKEVNQECKRRKPNGEETWSRYLVELKFWPDLWLQQLETLLRHPAEKQQPILETALEQQPSGRRVRAESSEAVEGFD